MSLLARATMAELAALERLLDPGYPETWGEIVACLYLQLRMRPALVPDDAAAAALALALAEGLRAELGGSQPYLAKGASFELSVRDREILAKFNGRNHDALAREFGLTPRQIYNVVDRRIREDVARRQGTLALDSDD